MSRLGVALAGAVIVCAAAAHAEPVTNNNPSAVDVAATPLNDLNLRKKKIPSVLIRAESHPYTVSGGCPAIQRDIAQLNDALGPDVDKEHSSEGLKAGRVARSVVGSMIPFEGIIRQISGAASEQRDLQNAITAGIARRGFLKGYGRAKHCRV